MSIRDLSLSFGGIVALNGVSFDLAAGRICGLIGPNGAGKTTLFNCISGLYRADSGTVTVDGRDILSLRPDQIAAVGIARTFQNVGLIPSLSVYENVLLGSHHRARGGFITNGLGLRSARRDERIQRGLAAEIVTRFGLDDVAGLRADGLPFGTLKRIELARAMMAEPRVLILDEPASGLVHEEVMELASLVKSLATEHQLSVLLVEHHMGMVLSISDTVVVLNFGEVIASGLPHAVAADPIVVEAYLGVAS